ncbi:MAG: hypothetical protein KF816_15210 [Melioribacteraceae bacterium]|jgi:lysophospholipase L1-like esterase|nr:hypothetical protein [Melioribacteraceae bacterium]
MNLNINKNYDNASFPANLLITCFLFLFMSFNLFSQNMPDSLRYKTNKNYQLQTEMYEVYKTKQADIVMLGNSLTHGANWNELLGRSNVVERGIVSDILPGFNARINGVIRLKPKIVFIMGGLNDIYSWSNVPDIFKQYVKLIELLKSKNIIPVIQSTTFATKDYGKDYGGTAESNLSRNQEVVKLNKLLGEYAQKNNIDFIDLTSQISTRDGFLRSDLTWDGIHFKASAYKIWAREVEKILNKYKL